MPLPAGVITSLSVSQAEQFDPSQTGGCPRRWYFERVEGRRPEKTEAHTDGDAGHDLLATYLTGGTLPKRARMLTAVKGAIAAVHLPAPGPNLLVERRFDEQPKRDASGKWLPLDTTKTLWLGGVPWDGFVDLQFVERDDFLGGDVVTVLDHKFSSDIHQYAKPSDGLLRTVQMPVYAANALRRWPDARGFMLAHHYVSRRGVDSFVRQQHVTVEQVRERCGQVEQLVAEMQTVARFTSQEDVPFNRRACGAYSGCPHQSICSAFKGKKMQMTKEELELFGLLEQAPAKTGKEQTAAELQRAADEAARAADEDGDGAHVAEAQELQRAADEAKRAEAGHGAADGMGGEDFPDIPLPTASTPAPQALPTCGDCGTELSAQNGSRLQSGEWKHVGCPMAAPETATCGDCPHPAHPGRPCGAKRGRGSCRCGQAAEVRPERPQPPSAPTFQEPDSSDGEVVAVEPTRLRGVPPEPDTVSEPAHVASISVVSPVGHALQVVVRVEIDLSPGTIALLERLLGR